MTHALPQIASGQGPTSRPRCSGSTCRVPHPLPLPLAGEEGIEAALAAGRRVPCVSCGEHGSMRAMRLPLPLAGEGGVGATQAARRRAHCGTCRELGSIRTLQLPLPLCGRERCFPEHARGRSSGHRLQAMARPAREGWGEGRRGRTALPPRQPLSGLREREDSSVGNRRVSSP